MAGIDSSGPIDRMVPHYADLMLHPLSPPNIPATHNPHRRGFKRLPQARLRGLYTLPP